MCVREILRRIERLNNKTKKKRKEKGKAGSRPIGRKGVRASL